MSIIIETPIDEFKKIVKKSKCYAEICRNLEINTQGGHYRTIKRKIKNNNIDISHFLPLKDLLKNVRNFNWISKENFIENLKNGYPYCIDTIKKKILEFNLIEYICNQCGLGNTWNKKCITLQIDHIDGNHNNNKLENFRWLCPNCHSQTETYCGKAKKKKIYRCKCGKIIYKKSKLCVKCEMERRKEKCKDTIITSGKRKPDKKTLYNLIISKPFSEIGKMYGVSGNAVVKWCKSHNLPYRKKDIKSGADGRTRTCGEKLPCKGSAVATEPHPLKFCQ